MGDFDTFPELDDQLAEIGDPEAAAESGTFVIDSIDAANWAVSKLAIHASRLAECEAFARRELARLTLWLEGQREQAEQASSFLAGLLRRYHEGRLAEQGIDVHDVSRDEWGKVRDKTIKLPAGELVARKGADEWLVDDDVLLAWAKANKRTDIVRPRPDEVDRNAVKQAFIAAAGKAVTTDGDVVPGITVTEGELKFKVRPRVVDQ